VCGEVLDGSGWVPVAERGAGGGEESGLLATMLTVPVRCLVHAYHCGIRVALPKLDSYRWLTCPGVTSYSLPTLA
jgi:hypothetical protein